MRSILYTLAFVGVLLTSCSKKKEDTPEPYKVVSAKQSLYYNETSQFTASQGGIELNGYDVTWTSSDNTVATVEPNGLLKAKKIGSVTITAAINGKFSIDTKITVTPYSTLCKEPFFEDGASIALTKSREFRTLATETATSLYYTGENAKLRSSAYLFKDGKMTSGALLFANTQAVVNEAEKFYNERYIPLGTENNFIFYGDDKGLVIGISIDANIGFNAIYFKSTTKTQNVDAKTVQEFNKIKTNLLKQKDIL